MIPDKNVNWYVDYNFDNISVKTGLPVGTLRIPAFLIHNDKAEVGARVILKKSVEHLRAVSWSCCVKTLTCLSISTGADSSG